MPDTDLAAVQAGAVAFDMDSVKGFCKLGAITLLDTRRHIPAKDHDRWQRRAIEAAVEVLYREPMPEPAGMRAASTLYSGGAGGARPRAGAKSNARLTRPRYWAAVMMQRYRKI